MRTGHSWEYVGQHWDLPRLAVLGRVTCNLPPLDVMLGRFLGYPSAEPKEEELTMEQHAARLMGTLTQMG